MQIYHRIANVLEHLEAESGIPEESERQEFISYLRDIHSGFGFRLANGERLEAIQFPAEALNDHGLASRGESRLIYSSRHSEDSSADAMRSKKIDFDVVRELALSLPGVEESGLHGAPSLKVSGRLLTCPALHKSAEPNSLVVRVDFAQRAKLIEDEPGAYYVTDHYVKHPMVLVRLGQVDRNALRALLRVAWEFASSKTKASRRTAQKL